MENGSRNDDASRNAVTPRFCLTSLPLPLVPVSPPPMFFEAGPQRFCWPARISHTRQLDPGREEAPPVGLIRTWAPAANGSERLHQERK